MHVLHICNYQEQKFFPYDVLDDVILFPLISVMKSPSWRLTLSSLRIKDDLVPTYLQHLPCILVDWIQNVNSVRPQP